MKKAVIRSAFALSAILLASTAASATICSQNPGWTKDQCAALAIVMGKELGTAPNNRQVEGLHVTSDVGSFTCPISKKPAKRVTDPKRVAAGQAVRWYCPDDPPSR